MRQFKSLINNKPVDLVEYVKQYVEQRPSTELLIGCDSQNRKRETIYAVVVGLYTPKKGAHVLYSKFATTKERENVTRLLNEVWFSVEVAEELKTKLNIIPTWIDIDLNPDPKRSEEHRLNSSHT